MFLRCDSRSFEWTCNKSCWENLAMMWVFLIVVIVFGLAWTRAPREMWRITQGWQYKNPEANKPSDAAYTMQRISAIVAIVVIVISIGALILSQKAASEQREKDSRVLERSQKEEREELGYPEFARRTREVFGVPGSEVVIRYPRESSLGKESLDKIEGGLAPVGWLPYDNERSEPSFLSYLIGTGVKGGWGLR